MKKIILFALAIAPVVIFSFCNNHPAEETTDKVPDPSTYFHRVSEYKKHDGSYTATYFAPDTNWVVIKEKLIADLKALPAENRKNARLVCYNDLSYTPSFVMIKDDTTDVTESIYNPELDKYRACSLDNEMGFWRFAYDGTRTDYGRVGDWSEIESLDSLNLDKE